MTRYYMCSGEEVHMYQRKHHDRILRVYSYFHHMG